MSLHLYAVLEPPPPPTLTGLPAGLRLVSAEGLSAAVSEAEPLSEPTADGLQRHDRIVNALAESSAAVLPARFGCFFTDEAALRRELAVRAPELRQALVLVRGRVQMTLRVWDTTHAQRARPPEMEGPGAGRRYLAARAAELRGDDVPGLPALLEALRPLAAAERIERHASPPLVASVHHLVDRDRVEEYRLRAGAARATHAKRRAQPGHPIHLRVRLSGPWAPYAFAEGAS